MEKEISKFEKLEEIKEKLPENVKIIETPEAKFRIIYGIHIRAQRPEELGSADALALEMGYDYTNKEKAEKLIKECGEHTQYISIIERAKNQNKPIFLLDVPGAKVRVLMRGGLMGIEAMGGYHLIRSLAKDIRGKKELTRREFLKRSTKGIAGLYFLSQLSGVAIAAKKIVDNKAKLRTVERFIIDLNEKIHPETEAITLTLRNHLMAQKLKTIAGRLGQSRKEKPEVALVIGAAHIGIEKALQKQDPERIALVDKLLRVPHPGLKKVREKIATIARLDFDKDKNKWVAEIFKDPHLAPIERK